MVDSQEAAVTGWFVQIMLLCIKPIDDMKAFRTSCEGWTSQILTSNLTDMLYLGNHCWTEQRFFWQMMGYRETVILRIFCVQSYYIKAFHLWGEETHLTSLEVLFPSSKNGQWETKHHQPYCSWGTLTKCFSLGLDQGSRWRSVTMLRVFFASRTLIY